MMLLEGIYSGVVAARNSVYDRNIFRSRALRWPVISVGNISAGGSGKTPFVIMLGQLFAGRGMSVDVLSRGYRRSTRGVLTVNPQGRAEEFGDEPLLIARTLRCPVIVGENRYAAGLAAEKAYQGTVSDGMHLLDDGFQHRQLHRDFDVVLLTSEDVDDKLLPSGRLREPLSSLSRADAVVVDKSFPLERLPRAGFQFWHAERHLQIPKLEMPVVAFCGVARPHRFFADLRAAGLDVVEEIAFRDHHRYTIADVQRLTAAQARIPGSRLVTTEKDAINLGSHRSTLDPQVIPMEMRLADSHAALQYLLDTIAKRRASATQL
jgi:tetraacyldisaccharide 4'-kinase